MTIPLHRISNSKVNQFGGVEIEQSSDSNLPKKCPQMGNPSIGPTHPKWFSYAVASPWFSKFALVPFGTSLDLQVHHHQDLGYVWGWEQNSLINSHGKHHAHASQGVALAYMIALLSFSKLQRVHNI